jgi:hypothetical protein
VGKLILAAQHTEEKFLTGVVDTGEQFFDSVVDTSDKFYAFWLRLTSINNNGKFCCDDRCLIILQNCEQSGRKKDAAVRRH